MTLSMRRVIPAVISMIALVSVLGCTSAQSTSNQTALLPPSGINLTTVKVIRGNIASNIAVDGNLVMPKAFDLHFGTYGNVKDVNVEEGDYVKAGTVMATLDSSSLELDIKAANVDLQQTISNLYETIPDVQMTMNYPSFYPNSSASVTSGWAIEEVKAAQTLLEGNEPKESVAKLQIAIADLEACIKIFEDAISNPESGLGSATLEDVEIQVMTEGGLNEKYDLVRQWQDLINTMKGAQQDLASAAKSITDNKYASPYSLFYELAHHVNSIDVYVRDNVNRIQVRRVNALYPEESLCLYFYDQAEKSLNSALKMIKDGGINTGEYRQNLAMAAHNMDLCNAVLNSSLLVLEHGLTLKSYQQYNVEMEKKEVALANAKENLLKSVIVAPFDGMVVSVDVRKNDIMSAVDYTSKGTIQLVDTGSVQFKGLVDEIDTIKVKKGQEAVISVDAVSDTTFKGKVKFISPYGTTSGNVIKFAITIEMEPYKTELKGGLSASAEIAVTSVENVLKVPLTAVSTTKDGSFVTVLQTPPTPPEKRKVTLGVQDTQYVEVQSGVKEGEELIIGAQDITGTTTPSPPQGGRPPNTSRSDGGSAPR